MPVFLSMVNKKKLKKKEEGDAEESQAQLIWPLISKARTELSLWTKEDRAATAINGLQRGRQMKFCFHPETGKQVAAMEIFWP